MKKILMIVLGIIGLAGMHQIYTMDSWFSIPKSACIDFYDKDKPFYQFTNFFQYPIIIDSKIWPTTEHYYQAMKFTGQHAHMQETIRTMQTPRDAFEFARKHPNMVRSDWRQVNLDIMLKALRAKFKYADLKKMLLGTDNKILIENAGANDAFFGAGATGQGNNHLGQMLMHVRGELQGKIPQNTPYTNRSPQEWMKTLKITSPSKQSDKNHSQPTDNDSEQKQGQNWFTELSLSKKVFLFVGSLGMVGIACGIYYLLKNKSIKKTPATKQLNNKHIINPSSIV